MRVFHGVVEKRHGNASGNLRDYVSLIGERIGIVGVVEGTLNVRIDEPYVVPADVNICRQEYNNRETLKLKRCRLRGIRCCIMRPNFHELCEHPRKLHDALTRLEIMSNRKLRDALRLKNGDIVEVEIDGDDEWWFAPEMA